MEVRREINSKSSIQKLLLSHYGMDIREKPEAIKYGICKINIATDARLLWTRVHREFFRDSPELFDPINPGKIYIEEYVTFMEQKFDLLGATGKAIEFNQ
jgi:fructose-bisphosphate aldolase class II